MENGCVHRLVRQSTNEERTLTTNDMIKYSYYFLLRCRIWWWTLRYDDYIKETRNSLNIENEDNGMFNGANFSFWEKQPGIRLCFGRENGSSKAKDEEKAKHLVCKMKYENKQKIIYTISLCRRIVKQNSIKREKLN